MYLLSPDYALEILLRLEIAATSSVSSIFFLEMGVTIPSSYNLVGTLDLIALQGGFILPIKLLFR